MTHIDKMLGLWKKNYNKMIQRDTQAQQRGELVGRFIDEPIADGYAYYEIVRENKNTVRIKHITGVGDDYMVHYWGSIATIDKDYALQSIKRREALANIFS